MAPSELHSRNTDIGEGQVICPKCGEVNSSNFLFCGMCGAILEPARKATAPVAVQTPRPAESISAANSGIVTPQAALPVPPAPPRLAANEPTPPISGPSLLGLDQGNVDVLRERAFSGLASYDRHEPRSAGKEVLLTIVLLAALGGAGWWAYKNYIGVTGIRKPTPEVAVPGGDAANAPPSNPTPSKEEEKALAKSAAPAEPTASEKSTENSDTSTEAKPPVATPETPEAKAKAEEAKTETPSKPATPAPTQARHEVSATRIPASKPPAPADPGDALFRRGESYLYGRNGTEDCGNALKYLKMAADQQHAKARSMMGTMYATGHCVPRDLPNSYRWFALALRVDPNNSILEKDLRAVWNQMTPPERQLATKSQ